MADKNITDILGARISTALQALDWVKQGNIYYKLQWVPTLSGGTESEDANYRYYRFNSSGTLTCTRPGLCDVLVVGGGGAAGISNSTDDYGTGGGGGGGVIYTPLFAIVEEEISVTIGAGGNPLSTNGGNSVFKTITAYGGVQGHASDRNRGQAGGASGAPTTFSGGIGDGGTSWIAGGGGGGAGAVGGDSDGVYPNMHGGVGGVGLACSITGSSVYYGGGGGGGSNSGTPAAGGNGGGGIGGANNSTCNGTDNFGGGGGGNSITGGGNSGNNSVGYGGKGVVIIRIAK